MSLLPDPMNSLPVVNDREPVPVYDCHILLRVEEGRVFGRVTTLPGLTAEGHTERDVLRSLVEQFKQAVRDYRARGVEVPWQPQEAPAKGESQRWVPVHL